MRSRADTTQVARSGEKPPPLQGARSVTSTQEAKETAVALADATGTAA